jgi:hypothetical protein
MLRKTQIPLFFLNYCPDLPKRPKQVPKCGLFCILAFLEKLHFTNSFLCWKESLVPDSAPWYISVPSEGLKSGDCLTKKYTEALFEEKCFTSGT